MHELAPHNRSSPLKPSRTLPARGTVQRTCVCGGTPGPTGECATCRRNHKLGEDALQTKLCVSRPGDRYEREADRTAEAVIRAPHLGSGPLPITPIVPRSGNDTQAAAPPEVGAALAVPGRPLDGSTRASMEARIGRDLSHVRIHTGQQAAASARAVEARAYTVGHDVVFGPNEYRPGTTRGRLLLAHELAHVVQQTGPDRKAIPTSGVRAGGDPSNHLPPSPVLPRPSPSTARTSGTVQRESFAERALGFLSQAYDELMLAQRIREGAIFTGSKLLIVSGGTITNRFRAVSGSGGSEWEKNVGPIPDGEYWIRPDVEQSTITKIERGTGGANAISTGHQKISVTEKASCDPTWGYCTLDCSAEYGAGSMCWNTTTVWGERRIKIQPGSVEVSTPSGGSVTRTGFYIHGGTGSVNVTSGCIKVFDNSAFSELLKFKGKTTLVVKKV